jgi:hypothetical protein
VNLFANLVLGTALSAGIWASALACGTADANDAPDPVLNRSREMAAKYFNIEVAKAVWHWRHNPAGMFADWNPYVSCAHDQS